MSKRMMAIFMLLGLISACNTMQGAGKDIERGGEKIQGAAENAK
ncbi:MAG: entericidin A/B family lipoprotein [Pseudomonadota bacterium]